ncbi:MAG: hypothetical protein HZC48_03585 [Nitrospirae bacterium]|nr:hypothetical protein [Nitrospirota bacterium]
MERSYKIKKFTKRRDPDDRDNAGSMDSAFIKMHGYGEPGMHALITVSDTGEAMSDRIREKIFEPFFTTKEVGRGTGLGLSIVYGIVKQHNGYINCYSEPGKGATFKIYLPLIKDEAEKIEIAEEELQAAMRRTLYRDSELKRALNSSQNQSFRMNFCGRLGICSDK